jgi:hypothetical protein
LPGTDRLAQSRSAYAAGQEMLANKQLRWWWHNTHQAVYDTGDGQGMIPRGAPTAWVPQSKSLTFAEFGVPTCDRGTNQPNVFYDPKSTESFTPFWSIWDPAAGASFAPRRDDLIAALALEAIVEYWTTDGHNETSAAGIPLIETAFMSAWNWDARPFPAFPQLPLWGDRTNWPTGTWIGGKDPNVAPPEPDSPPIATAAPSFPTLVGEGWTTHYRPVFTTNVATHVSGRESRAGRVSAPLWDIELTFDSLSGGIAGDIATLAGFYGSVSGADQPFLLAIPAELGIGATLLCRFADDQLDAEEFAARLFAVGSLPIKSLRG